MISLENEKDIGDFLCLTDLGISGHSKELRDKFKNARRMKTRLLGICKNEELVSGERILGVLKEIGFDSKDRLDFYFLVGREIYLNPSRYLRMEKNGAGLDSYYVRCYRNGKD